MQTKVGIYILYHQCDILRLFPERAILYDVLFYFLAGKIEIAVTAVAKNKHFENAFHENASAN